MDDEIIFRIILQAPPAGADYGLQKGKGNEYETIQKQRSVGKDVHFEFAAKIKTAKNGLPDFSGPFVQGPSEERFVYIDIGTYAGQTDSQWSRKLKVPFRDITSAMMKKLSDNTKMILETKVPGTAKDGGPNCATVKPFDGWKVVSK